MSVSAHRKDAPASVRCVVVTVSDTRTESNDTSGDAIVELLKSAGHDVGARRIVRDDPEAVRSLIRSVVESNPSVADVIITTGGTGITARDSTYEAIEGELTLLPDDCALIIRDGLPHLQPPAHEPGSPISDDCLIMIGMARAFLGPKFRSAMLALVEDAAARGELDGIISVPVDRVN